MINCVKFHGRAAQAMNQPLAYAEQNLAFKDRSRSRGRSNPANVPLATSLRLRELLEAARQTAGDTVYGKCIAASLAELQPKEALMESYRLRKQAPTPPPAQDD